MSLATTAPTLAVPIGETLSVTQYPQHNYFYCGPSVAYSAIRYAVGLHNSVRDPSLTLTQEHLAGSNYLLTDTYTETRWFLPDGRSSGYDNYMPRALNRWLGGTPYYQEKLPDDGGGRLRSIVLADIASYNRPVIAATVEYAGGSHFNYHPNRTIYHWVGIRGYGNSGNTIIMWDPIANSGVSGYSSSLPYFNLILGTAQFYIVVNEMQATQNPARGRGVVW